MPITLEQHATLQHINIRKEGPDDEKHLVVDLKLQLITTSDILIEFDPTLRLMLFTSEGEKRYPKLAPIKWGGEMRHMELEIAGVEFMDVTLRKFQIDPLSLRGQEFVDLTFQATFSPGGRETAIIAEQVGEETLVKIKAAAQLDLVEKTVADAVADLRDLAARNNASITITGPDGRSATIDGVDPLYQQAVEIVKSTAKCSISHIQRQLRIGYNRAARLIENMEGAGVVSMMDASGQRKVLANAQLTGAARADD